MARSKSCNHWLREHVSDPYVNQAQKDRYRSRAAYKLLEIHAQDQLIRPGAVVVDLGASPGSWSQVAARLVGGAGKVFSLDILGMEPVPGVDFIRGDFREEEVLKRFVQLLAGHSLDLVISDMAPNISGMSTIDQARSMLLCELALQFARDHLRPGGAFLVKVFQGRETQAYITSMLPLFKQIVIRKPKASRPRSNEIYVLGKSRR